MGCSNNHGHSSCSKELAQSQHISTLRRMVPGECTESSLNWQKQAQSHRVSFLLRMWFYCLLLSVALGNCLPRLLVKLGQLAREQQSNTQLWVSISADDVTLHRSLLISTRKARCWAICRSLSLAFWPDLKTLPFPTPANSYWFGMKTIARLNTQPLAEPGSKHMRRTDGYFSYIPQCLYFSAQQNALLERYK